jgi:FkbM family methyltransferase
MISKKVKAGLKKMFRFCGLEVSRARPFDKYEWLKGRNIKTVIDVGANIGQFAGYIHKLLPEARIYSFEPLKACYEQLLNRMGHVRDFRAFQFALGNQSGKTRIYANNYSPSSSLLPMEKLHEEAFPYTRNTTAEEIEIRCLDDISRHLDIEGDLLIKIDVQGFEDKVILGGEKTVSRASILIVETSFRALYKGQPLFDDIYDMLRQRGFSYTGSEEPLRHPKDGSILQCDCVFFRNSC